MSSFSPSSFLSLFDGSVIPFDQANSQSTNQPNLFDLSCFYDEAAVQIPDNAINTTPLQPTKQLSIRPTMHSESNKSVNQSKRSSGESTPFLDLQAVTSWMANLFTDDEPVDQSSDENSETNDSPRSSINQPQIQTVLPSTTQSTHPTSASHKSVKHQSADATPITIQSANQPTNSTSRALDLPKSSDPTTRGRPVNRAVNQSANHARLHRSPVLWKRSIESTSKSSQTSHSSTHQSINLSDKHPKVTSQTSSSSTPAPAAPSRSRPDVRRASKPVLNVKCLSDSSASISLSPDSERASNPIPCASQSVVDDQSINQPGEAVTESSSSGDNISGTSTSNQTVDASMSVGTQMPSPAAHNVDTINQPTPIVKMTLIGSALNEANLDYFAAESGSMIIVHHEEHQPTNQQQLSDDDSQEWDSFDDDVDEIVDIDTLRDRKRADNQPINQCDDDWTPVRVDEMSSSGSSEEFEILDQKVLQQQ